MRRWLVVLVALVIAVGAVYSLASMGADKHDPEIGDASRRELLGVLREENP